jgi:hypothetical protein
MQPDKARPGVAADAARYQRQQQSAALWAPPNGPGPTQTQQGASNLAANVMRNLAAAQRLADQNRQGVSAIMSGARMPISDWVQQQNPDFLKNLVGNSQGDYGSLDVASNYAAQVRAKYAADLAAAQNAGLGAQQAYLSDPSKKNYQAIRDQITKTFGDARLKQVDALTNGMSMDQKRQLFGAIDFQMARGGGAQSAADNAQTRAYAFGGTAWPEEQADAQRAALAQGGIGIWSQDDQAQLIKATWQSAVQALSPYLGKKVASALGSSDVTNQIVASQLTQNQMNMGQSKIPAQFDATYGVGIPNVTDPIAYEQALATKQKYSNNNASNIPDLGGGSTGIGTSTPTSSTTGSDQTQQTGQGGSTSGITGGGGTYQSTYNPFTVQSADPLLQQQGY